MVKLGKAAMDRIRRDHPHYDRDVAVLETAVRDCAVAYFWNPIVSSEEFAYLGWSTTLYAGIDEATRTVHVVFRGTDQAIDWVVNLACVPLPLRHRWAHGGFLIAWKLARRRLAPWLAERRTRFDRVVVAGHSLGGALATACAYELATEGFDVAHCITVGGPRVYLRWSAPGVEAVLGDRLMRVCREQDLVPKVPPAFLGYRHVGKAWAFAAEALGERMPEPFPETEKRLGKLWYWFYLGPLGDWLRAQGVTRDFQSQLMIFALAGLAGLGGAWAVTVNVSLAALLYGTLLFLVVSGALVALAAHRSGHYTATREAVSLVEEWQLHGLRRIAATQTLEPATGGNVRVNLSVEIGAHHGPQAKRRFVRAFRGFFGPGTFTTSLGRRVQDAQDASARPDGPAGSDPALERSFRNACVGLALYGYSSPEIDRIIAGAPIVRPERWTRFYAPASAATAAPAAAHPAVGAPATAALRDSRSAA